MSDDTQQQQFAPAAPSLSEDGLSYYRDTLNRLELQASMPSASLMDKQAAVNLKTWLGQALSVTGQTLQVDNRTTPQQMHDRLHGVQDYDPGAYDIRVDPDVELKDGETAGAQAFVAAMNMPPHLGSAVANDLLNNGAADPEDVKQQMADMGYDYEQTMAKIDKFFAVTGRNLVNGRVEIDARQLPIFSAIQIANWADHHNRWSANRPK